VGKNQIGAPAMYSCRLLLQPLENPTMRYGLGEDPVRTHGIPRQGVDDD